jgi:NAD(P)-dependent dehydrogenase (short-subunit alcohol dehydrogenase family)
MPGKLNGKVAVVAGASRGAGRGIALALGDAGATVYVTGRTTRGGPKPIDGALGTVEDTAEEVTSRGGQGIAVPTDCTNPAEVSSLFERVQGEQSRLDVMACSIFDGLNFMQGWGKPFWEQPDSDWREGIAGATALYLTARHATAMMAKQKSGLIVGITDMVMDDKEPRGYCGHMMQDIGHETIDRLMFNMSHELKKHRVAVCTLMPGFMRTERVLMHLKTEVLKKQFGFERSESTEFLGRAVAALAADPKGALARSGKISFVADIAQQYGFTDIDGRVVPRFHVQAG